MPLRSRRGFSFRKPQCAFLPISPGIATIALIALLLARMGFERAGALAALILALHPWYMRFVPEARGYALVFFFAAINWHCLLGMTRSGRWGWWIGFAVSEFCMIYTWPGAIPLVLLTNVLLVGWIISKRPVAGALVWRWAGVSVLVGIVLFQLLLPCVPQFAAYLKDCVRMPMEWYWLRNVGSLLVTGSHWTKTGRLDSPYPEFFPVANSHPVLAVALLVAVLVFLGWGVVRLVRDREPALKIFAGLWLLTGPVTFLIAKLKGEYLFEWYMAYAVPGLVCLVAVGNAPRGGVQEDITGRCRFSRDARNAVCGCDAQPACLFSCRGRCSSSRSRFSSRGPRSIPMRKKIAWCSRSPRSRVRKSMTRRCGARRAFTRFRSSSSKLTRRRCRSLSIRGYPSALKAEFPATYAMVNDPELFERIGEFPAVEEMLDRVVYRYKPGSIAGKDIKAYGENPPLNRAFIY